MFTHLVLLVWLVGIIYFAAGLFFFRKDLAAVRGLDFCLALGPIFVAAPLATFAAEHFVDAASMRGLVPAWFACASCSGSTSLAWHGWREPPVSPSGDSFGSQLR